MNRTRLSFLYVICYLTASGISLTFFPQWGMQLMFSNGNYDDTFMRVTGVFLLGLAAIVTKIFLSRAEALYSTLIWVRVMFCVAYIVFYQRTHDPFFITLLIIVGGGLVASTACYLLDLKGRVVA